MGLSKAAVGYLMEEAAARPFSGAVLMLGVQGVFLDEAGIERLADERGLALAPVPGDLVHPPLLDGMASAEYLFRRLGFDRVVATDVSDFEGAGLIFDLNAAAVPDGEAGRYDLVLDSGTLEHVFHLPNALKNLLDFTAEGGRIVHLSPSSNHIDHGFYMFSPTFFWDFYTANGVEILTCDLYRYTMPGHDRDPWLFGSYRPGSLAKVSMGSLGGGCFGVAATVRRTGPQGPLKIPQQGAYVAAWKGSTAPARPERRPRTGPGAAISGTWKRARGWIAGRLPLPLRVAARTMTARFPLKVRRRF